MLPPPTCYFGMGAINRQAAACLAPATHVMHITILYQVIMATMQAVPGFGSLCLHVVVRWPWLQRCGIGHLTMTKFVVRHHHYDCSPFLVERFPSHGCRFAVAIGVLRT